MDTPLTFAAWSSSLTQRGFTVLPSSHAVPIELWLRTPFDGPLGNEVLHLRARGTRVTLRRFSATALAGLILRSECDCEEHRTAGATTRTSLVPGAQPLAEVVYDGAADLGWVGYQAGLLDVPSASVLFDRLLAEIAPGAVPQVA
ncbi:MAG TPA: hypothetical protein VFK41_09265 [Nocardioidaceae bacterium]|nr:hypothetical protein [Nocardioidaceae bacterium]